MVTSAIGRPQTHIETLRVIAIYELEWRIRQRRADTEVAGNDDIKVHEASCIEGGIVLLRWRQMFSQKTARAGFAV